jgi:hypothetical protein
MAVRYAGGTNVNTTIAADTRALLLDNLQAQLITAGWTLAAGDAAIPITGATNATPIVVSSAGHGLVSGAQVLIQGVGGNTAANGSWVVTYVSVDTFSLDTSIGDGDYTTGGLWLLGSSVAITGATNATPIEITSSSHGRSTGDKVLIQGVGGNTAADGEWTITRTGANTFTLDTSVGNGDYTTGGVWLTPSGRWKLDSAITPEGHGARVRLHDSGGGNCAQVFISDQAETLVCTSQSYILPAAGKSYVVLANKYQFFLFEEATNIARQFVAAGVVDVFSFLSLQQAAWMMSNNHGDTDADVSASFNTKPYSGEVFGGRSATILHNQQWSAAEGNGPSLLFPNALTSRYRCFDYTLPKVDAIMSLALSSSGERFVVGQLWDAFWCLGSWNSGSLVTHDSKQFMAVTHNNTSAGYLGTLFIYAPA